MLIENVQTHKYNQGQSHSKLRKQGASFVCQQRYINFMSAGNGDQDETELTK